MNTVGTTRHSLLKQKNSKKKKEKKEKNETKQERSERQTKHSFMPGISIHGSVIFSKNFSSKIRRMSASNDDYSSHVPSYYPLCQGRARAVSHFFKLVNSLQAPLPSAPPTPVVCNEAGRWCTRGKVQIIIMPITKGPRACGAIEKSRETVQCRASVCVPEPVRMTKTEEAKRRERFGQRRN